MKRLVYFVITVSLAAIVGLASYLLMITRFLPNEGPVQGELDQMAFSFLLLLLFSIVVFNLPTVYLMRRRLNDRMLIFVCAIINLILITIPYALVRLVDGKKVNLLSDESVSVNAPLVIASLIFTLGWGWFSYRQRMTSDVEDIGATER